MSNDTNLPASAQSKLIPIQNNDGAQAVLGRDLHAFLEIGKDYSTWFKDMCQYGFIAGQDFTPKSGKTSEAGGRPRIDHIISLEMAKEICMIQRSPLGNQARQYYIECERRARNNVPALSGPELVARALIEAQNMLEEKDQQIKELAPRAGAWETFCGSSGDMSVADTAKALNSRRGVDTGRDRLFKMMQELGWTTHCHGYWEPMQYAVERGYLAVKVNMPRWRPNGESFVPAPTVRVTPKGLDRLAESLPTRRVGGADSEQ
ncbi:antA/AntB antirepressor family protein [Lawsonella clevelandensis]|uniref:antA/AntB antirepressor family protein n=1 Tax=Lawsonella clevelandensis TaxID=1528099 RepID=UPI0027BAF039|nr:antA/AntB antirepressor family protein [Lawsonella clevelandensis]